MTKLLEQALEIVRRLPADGQDAVAHAMLALARGDEDELEDIAPEHLSAVLEGLSESRRGEFAGDDEVEAAFRRFGR